MNNQIKIMTTVSAILLFTSVCTMATPVFAQTTFDWPAPGKHAVGFDQEIDMCVARARRIGDSVVNVDPTWVDTLRLQARRETQPFPAVAQTFAKQCSAKFDPSTVQNAQIIPLMQLMLIAGRDAEADQLAQRKLSQITDTSEAALIAVLDSVRDQYVWALPTRLSAVNALYQKYWNGRIKGTWVQNRLRWLLILNTTARWLDDSAVEQQTRDVILRLPERFTDKEREELRVLGPFYYFLSAKANAQALEDSLRQSSSSYAAFHRTLWAQATGEKPEAILLAIGKQAPPINGEFGFPAEAKGRPTKGKVSLLWFEGVSGYRQNLYESFGILKRLAQRFPDLEITNVANTKGYFDLLDPPTPPEEARLMYEYYQKMKLPGAFVVSNTPYWRLQVPDGRRVYEPTEAQNAYRFGRRNEMPMTLLVDQDGVVILENNLTRDTEEDFARLIKVLLERREK